MIRHENKAVCHQVAMKIIYQLKTPFLFLVCCGPGEMGGRIEKGLRGEEEEQEVKTSPVVREIAHVTGVNQNVK